MKTVLILLTVLSFNIHRASAQQERLILSTNVLNLAALGPSFAVSYDFSPKFTLQAYTSAGKINVFSDYKYQTAILDFKFRNRNNTYFGPYIRYINKQVYRNAVWVFDGGRDFEGDGISGGVCLGSKFQTKGIFSLEAFGGLGVGGFVAIQRGEAKAGFIDARIGILSGIKL